MMTRQQYRLECLKMANSMAASKNIQPKEVIPTAMEYFRWVDDAPDDEADTSQLAQRFRVHR